MANTETYEVAGTLNHGGDLYTPGDEIELTEDEARPLLDRDPPAIQTPGAGAPPPSPTTQPNPLAPETIAEVEAILPAIDDPGRLEAALEGEDRVGAVEAIEDRLDELADDDEA